MTPLDTALAVAAGAASVGALTFFVAYKKTRLRLDAVELELAELRGADRTQEYRLDRFDALWYPTVTFRPKSNEVLRAAPGVPHCKRCLTPFASRDGAWSCGGCGQTRPDSIADTHATDSVAREAVRWFMERHADFKLTGDLQRFKS